MRTNTPTLAHALAHSGSLIHSKGAKGHRDRDTEVSETKTQEAEFGFPWSDIGVGRVHVAPNQSANFAGIWNPRTREREGVSGKGKQNCAMDTIHIGRGTVSSVAIITLLVEAPEDNYLQSLPNCKVYVRRRLQNGSAILAQDCGPWVLRKFRTFARS